MFFQSVCKKSDKGQTLKIKESEKEETNKLLGLLKYFMDKTMKDILMYMINNFYDNICDIAGAWWRCSTEEA